MQKKIMIGTFLLLIFSATILMKPSSAVDTLTPNDFKLESFSKTVDFFNFARNYAAASGKTPPPANWHAYLYQNYINVSGFQLYYSGLINITAGEGALTIPVQSFIEHYKTPTGKDVLTSSSFIMLLAFNDTAGSLHDNSPDINDNLYASFSLGLDLADIYGDSAKPALSSKTETIPLEKTGDNTWEWGMKYTNMTAVWWRMFINPLNPHFEVLPIAITTYDELTFMYKLTLDPSNNKATVTASYVIGRMTNLWLIYWILLIPVVVHYNATGAYRPNGTKISDETVYKFLENQHIKMSIILFQNSLVLNDVTKSTYNNQNVNDDADIDVSSGTISTQVGNEKVFDADFGTKKTYNLYNYTADPTETDFDEYNATTRTAPRLGFAKNPLFSMHVALLKYVPLIVAHIDPALYNRAKDHMLNMTYADYFYLISYPTYSGFKVKHDPTYTAYFTSAAATPLGPGIFGVILIGGIIAVAVIAVIIVLKRRAGRAPTIQQTSPPPPPQMAATAT